MIFTRKVVQPSHDHPLLIAFDGKERAGKTTSAQYIVNKYKGVKLAFADVLKRELYDLNALRGTDVAPFISYAKQNGHDIDFNALPLDKKIGPSIQDKIDFINANKHAFGVIMQVYGDFKRGQDPLYFVNRTMLDVNRLKTAGQNVIIIDDCRFNNEADALEAERFTLVRVQAADRVREARGTTRDNTHASETQLDVRYHHYTVFNNMELGSLYSQLDTVVGCVLNA